VRLSVTGKKEVYLVNKKRFFIQILIVVAVLVMMVAPVQAAGGISATLTPNQTELAVGDPVDLTLAVIHPVDTQVIIPQLEKTWGPFEVWGQSQATTVDNGNGTATTQQTLTVTLFDLGTFETPALPLTISDAGGQVTEEAVAPISLTVSSIVAEGDTQLRDIRPQASMNVPFPWPMIITGLVVLAVAIAGAWWLIHRLRKNGTLGRMVDNRPPFQVAYDELDRIDGMALPEKGQFKAHYTLVTDVLRQYLEKQFGVHAFDRTTSELKQSLQMSTMSPDHIRHFVDFFTDSDLVKFAKLVPDLDEARYITTDARTLVKLTRPRPEPEQAKTSPPTMTQNPVEVSQ
jgi:hypothetical protein